MASTSVEFHIAWCVPAALPNPEQLVNFSGSWLKLDFEDQAAPFRRLKAFYAFGQPLMTREYDLLIRHSSTLLQPRHRCGVSVSTAKVRCQWCWA